MGLLDILNGRSGKNLKKIDIFGWICIIFIILMFIMTLIRVALL